MATFPLDDFLSPVSIPSEDPQLLSYLASFLTPARIERIDQVLSTRSDHLRVVIEDIFQPHNASAVLRSCEGFGVQHVHIIENHFKFTPNRDIALGAQQWLTLHHHREKGADNTAACLSELRDAGYRLVATSPRADAVPLEELPIDRPIALLFGTEAEGLSDQALSLADAAMTIPMFGFVESFNISVSAAICLAHLMRRVRTERADWSLSTGERAALRDQWIRQSLKTPEALERRFWEDQARGNSSSAP